MAIKDVRTYSFRDWFKAYTAFYLTWPFFAAVWLYTRFFDTIPVRLSDYLLLRVHQYTTSHPMDFRIPPNTAIPAYMMRWWWVPRNPWFNVYLHHVWRSDDDRALHDHPWTNVSIVLAGSYTEHTIDAGGIHRRRTAGPGSIKIRTSGKQAHRLALPKINGIEQPAITIFITGPVLRRWGFHDPSGWVDAYSWDTFCAAKGITTMPMGGGSDGAISARNKGTKA